MDENEKKPEPTPPLPTDPEKILRGLDFELNHPRTVREHGSGNRTLFRVISLAVILGGAAIALYILSEMLAGLSPRAHHDGEATPTESAQP